MAEDKNAPGVGSGIASSAGDDPRVYFAAERTFLAWIRTGLGLMGVGFAVSRFGLFLREMRQSEVHAPVHATGLSVYSGVALVALGVVVNLSAVMQHIRHRASTSRRHVAGGAGLYECGRSRAGAGGGWRGYGSVPAVFAMSRLVPLVFPKSGHA